MVSVVVNGCFRAEKLFGELASHHLRVLPPEAMADPPPLLFAEADNNNKKKSKARRRQVQPDDAATTTACKELYPMYLVSLPELLKLDRPGTICFPLYAVT